MGKKTQSRGAKPVKNSKTVQNGSMAGAIGFDGAGAAMAGMFPGAGFPYNQGVPWSLQIANPATVFINLRWYLVSNFRQVLNEAYAELGLIQTIIDVPVDDALRGGLEVTSKQLEEDEIEQLKNEMDYKDDLNILGQAAKWNRLFGGAGVLILTDQDPATPLDMESIDADSPLEFRAVDMWELFWDKQNTEGFDPTSYENNFEHYSYYGMTVHKSRVLRMVGIQAPSFIRPRLRGWGLSVVETLIRSINQYLKATALTFEVLDEFKIDVFKVKNLVNTLLSPNGEENVRKRIQMSNWQKNYQNALVMDSEDDYDHKQLSFSGLAETMVQIRMQVAADMRMPMTKLFGISATGFNSGEDDIEVYNAMVESQVRNKIKYHAILMLKLRCQQLFGFVPDDLKVTFKPLRVMTSEQEENVKTQVYNRLLAAKAAGEITRFEFREGCNKDNLLPVSLDLSGDQLNPDDPEIENVITGADGDTDVEDPANADEDGSGSNRPTTAMPKIQAKTSPDKPKTPSGKPVQNSIEYEKAAFETDGGDQQFLEGRRHFFQNPGRVDEALWSKAKAASMKAFGREKWQFVVWYYKRLGGKFNG